MAALSATARAGRSDFAWVWDTQGQPAGVAEISAWIAEQNDVSPANHLQDTNLWVAPSIGITDKLELLVPFNFDWQRSDLATGAMKLSSFGADLVYRFAGDPGRRAGFVPELRARILREIGEPRDRWDVLVELAAGYTTGRVHAVANLGAESVLGPSALPVQLTPALGVSIEVVHDLRLGAEAFGDVAVNDAGAGNDSWIALGPNLAWTHGRFWLSAAYGIGLYHIRDAPKVWWGIAF